MSPETYRCAQGCPGALELRDDGVYYCAECFTRYEVEALERQREWRRLSDADRYAKLKELGDQVRQLFALTNKQVEALEQLRATYGTQSLLEIADIAPPKEALRNLGRSIDDLGAICELIDNAVDCHVRKGAVPSISFNIELDVAEGRIVASDNAGGMSLAELRRCLRLGATDTVHRPDTIGRFGVGAKEAIYHFGRSFAIETRERTAGKGMRVEINAAWLESKSWDTSIFETPDIEPGTTTIRVGDLDELAWRPENIRIALRRTYGRRLKAERLRLVVAGVAVDPPVSLTYLQPPELFERTYRFSVDEVHCELHIGILASNFDEGGIYLFAQDRLFKSADWDSEIARRLLTRPTKHDTSQHFRAELDFTGPIQRIPINANKDDLQENDVLKLAGQVFDRYVSPYLKSVNYLSRGLLKDVAQYTIAEDPSKAVVSLGALRSGSLAGLPAAPDPAKLENILKKRAGGSEPSHDPAVYDQPVRKASPRSDISAGPEESTRDTQPTDLSSSTVRVVEQPQSTQPTITPRFTAILRFIVCPTSDRVEVFEKLKALAAGLGVVIELSD